MIKCQISVQKEDFYGLPLKFIPEYPDARVEFCLEDGACPLLLTTEEQKKGRSLTQNGYQILTLEEAFGVSAPDEIRPDERWAEMPAVTVSPNDLAYCIYTSGSTGHPKGVMIEHRNIANYVNRNEKSVEIMHYAGPGHVNLALAIAGVMANEYKDPEPARRWFSKAESMLEPDRQMLYKIYKNEGHMFYARNMWKMGADYLIKAYELNPKDVSAAGLAAYCLQLAGDLKQAGKWYETVLDRCDREAPDYIFAKKRLTEIQAELFMMSQ